MWKRMREELIEAGYLEENRAAKDSRGRFATGFVFHVVPVGGFKPQKTGKNLPKMAAKPEAAQPPTAEPPPADTASTRDMKNKKLDYMKQEREELDSLSESRKKEIKDRQCAELQGKHAGLSDIEIERVLSLCQYPSQMPTAIEPIFLCCPPLN